jgi:hypothetical protein
MVEVNWDFVECLGPENWSRRKRRRNGTFRGRVKGVNGQN